MGWTVQSRVYAIFTVSRRKNVIPGVAIQQLPTCETPFIHPSYRMSMWYEPRQNKQFSWPWKETEFTDYRRNCQDYPDDTNLKINQNASKGSGDFWKLEMSEFSVGKKNTSLGWCEKFERNRLKIKRRFLKS